MKELKEKHLKKAKNRAMIFSPLTVLVLLVLVIFMARGVIRIRAKYKIARDREHEQTAILNDLQKQKLALEEKIKSLETEDGVEATLREQFRIKKPGEEMVIILEKEGE